MYAFEIVNNKLSLGTPGVASFLQMTFKFNKNKTEELMMGLLNNPTPALEQIQPLFNILFHEIGNAEMLAPRPMFVAQTLEKFCSLAGDCAMIAQFLRKSLLQTSAEFRFPMKELIRHAIAPKECSMTMSPAWRLLLILVSLNQTNMIYEATIQQVLEELDNAGGFQALLKALEMGNTYIQLHAIRCAREMQMAKLLKAKSWVIIPILLPPMSVLMNHLTLQKEILQLMKETNELHAGAYDNEFEESMSKTIPNVLDSVNSSAQTFFRRRDEVNVANVILALQYLKQLIQNGTAITTNAITAHKGWKKLRNLVNSLQQENSDTIVAGTVVLDLLCSILDWCPLDESEDEQRFDTPAGSKFLGVQAG
jgi:hypothetical protein